MCKKEYCLEFETLFLQNGSFNCNSIDPDLFFVWWNKYETFINQVIGMYNITLDTFDKTCDKINHGYCWGYTTYINCKVV